MLLRGTFPAYNVAVSDCNQPQRNNHSFTPRRQKSLLSSSVARSGPIMAVATNEQVAYEPSLADRLRLGSLIEDGLSYKEKFIIRCCEVGINKTATVETIANLLQRKDKINEREDGENGSQQDSAKQRQWSDIQTP